jgi:ribose transport system ATP-binding protein
VFLERVRALKQRASVVFVSHRLDGVLAINDRVCVMKDRQVVTSVPNRDLEVHKLHQLMVGRGFPA